MRRTVGPRFSPPIQRDQSPMQREQSWIPIEHCAHCLCCCASLRSSTMRALRRAVVVDRGAETMGQRPTVRRIGVLVWVVAPGVALLLVGCGGGDTAETPPKAAARPSPGTPAPGTPSPSATRPTSDWHTFDPGPPPAHTPPPQVEDALRAMRSLQLQAALREINSRLGAPEDVDRAGAQCADLRRDVPDPDRVAAQRFKVSEADGKRINALLRNRFCDVSG
jgi:hypothetical protein